MREDTDPTADLDELAAIKRIDKIELDLIDSWLRQINESPEKAKYRQNLLELRNLCVLRNRLLVNFEAETLVTTGAA